MRDSGPRPRDHFKASRTIKLYSCFVYWGAWLIFFKPYINQKTKETRSFSTMPRRRRHCPICGKENLAKLSNHLADMHGLSSEEREVYLSPVTSQSGEEESDEVMSTSSKGDIFSSSEDEASERSEDEDSDSESDSDDGDEEAHPWEELILDAASTLRSRYEELTESSQNDGMSELDAKKQAFSEILPELQKALRNVYIDRLHWMWDMKKDPIHKKIMETRKRLIEDDGFDEDEALTVAVKKRKFLLTRMLEDRQNFKEYDETSDDETDS